MVGKRGFEHSILVAIPRSIAYWWKIGGSSQPLHVTVKPDRQYPSGSKRCVAVRPVGRAIAGRLRSAHVNRLHNQGLVWQLVQQSPP